MLTTSLVNYKLAMSGVRARAFELMFFYFNFAFLVVSDIEDAVSKGRGLRGCPYFATRSALESADLVFAPYNYLVDPHIRETMKINLTGCIVVFDEAHNIQVVLFRCHADAFLMTRRACVFRTAVEAAPLWKSRTLYLSIWYNN